MKVHLKARGEEVWDVIENSMLVPTSVVNGVGTPKIKISWNEDDKKKILYKKESDKLALRSPKHG